MDLAPAIHCLLTRCTSSSILSPRVLITSGCISSASTDSFQLMSGWNAASQGYPRIISSSPKSVTKNFMSSVFDPHRTWRSTKSVMAPALLCVPSIFQTVLGFFNLRLPIFICFRILVLIKLSVAPESTRTCFSAFLCEDCKRVGILRLLYLHANTLFTPNTHAQTAGVACFKNPFLHLHRPPCPLRLLS